MTKTLWRSFAGGEITPELFGRFELTKFQTGLRKALNFLTLPHGPAVRRPGTRHVLEAYNSGGRVRLIPFAFSADQTMVLEFGHGYIRFHTNGSTVLEPFRTVTGVTLANPGVFTTSAAHGYAAGDWVFLAAMGGMPQLTSRWGIVASVPTATTFTLTDLFGAPINTSAMGGYAGSGNVSRAYTINSGYDHSHVFDIHYAQNSDVLTLTHPSYPAKQLARLGATNWSLTDVSFAPTLPAPTGLTVTPTTAVATNLSPQAYTVTAVASDGVTESLGASAAGTSNNLTLAGNYNTISWSAVVGASRYNIYKQRGGSYGFIGQTTGLSIVDDNVLADTIKVPPENIITLNTGGGEYPSAITYHEQRRWFAGTDNKAQSIFATRNGTESNLTSSVPSQDADGMEFRVAAQQQNRIRHLVPLSDLMALTAGGEFRIFADNQPAITPTSISVKPMGYSGASNVQPVVTSGSILYVQAQGSRVRELAYGGGDNNASGTYRSIDMTIMAPHLFNGYTISDLAYSRAPDQVCWAVRSDGTLLGMTYVPEQQVYGWHQHTTDGLIKSVCTVAEGSESATYMVVQRILGGRPIQVIERMASRLFTDQEDAYFVDCGGTYDGAPAKTIRGLWHLEGETVQILADGAVETEQIVTGGAITLEHAASVVHVGLPYTSDLETLPLALETMQAAGQGTLKNVREVHLRMTQTSLFKAGSTFDKLVANRSRQVSDPYDSPPSLETQEVRLQIDGNWNTDASICVRQDQPLPLSVLAMTLDVVTGG